MKTMTVHTRVTPEVKTNADKIFAALGLTTSQAISLFLNASVNKRGLPFELTLGDDIEKEIEMGSALAQIDGVKPSEEAKRIVRLYATGQIDYETAQFAIGRLHK